MTKGAKRYSNLEHRRVYRNRQRKINYDKEPGDENVSGTPWSNRHKLMVIAHSVPDRELSKKIGRSVRAIQVMRTKIKNGTVSVCYERIDDERL